jgi:hypothetical protein
MIKSLWSKRGPTLALWITVIAALALIAVYRYMPKPPPSFRGIKYGISSEELGTILSRKYGTAPCKEENYYLCITKRRAGSEHLFFETPSPGKRFLGARVECDSIGFEEALSELVMKYGKPAMLEQNSGEGNAWWLWNGDSTDAKFKIHITGTTTTSTITYRNASPAWDQQ